MQSGYNHNHKYESNNFICEMQLCVTVFSSQGSKIFEPKEAILNSTRQAISAFHDAGKRLNS